MTDDARPADRPGPRVDPRIDPRVDQRIDPCVDPEATLIVTRPEPEATRLVDGLVARGRRAFAFPALTIASPSDATALERRMAAIDGDALVIFVSPNAIRYAIGARHAPWPAKTLIGVMGPGSVETLATLGVAARIVAPRPVEGRTETRSDNERFDSEALFDALDEDLGLTRDFDGRVLIVRGNGGRGWLADRLRSAGVIVDEVEAYRRGRGAPGAEAQRELRRLFAARVPVAFVITSSEAVDHVIGLVETTLAAAADPADVRAWLFATPVIAPHRRIVERAEAAGFRRVVGVGPGDRGLYAAIE